MASTLTEDHAHNLGKPTASAGVVSIADNQGREALKDITCGSISGMLGKIIEQPFDTIKVRLQSQPYPPVYTGPLDCFRQSLLSPEGGLRSLYRGIQAPLVGAAIENSSLFFSYRIAQDILQTLVPTLPRNKDELPLKALAACGAMSGAVTSLLLTPIELIKCKMQYPVTSSLSNPLVAQRGPISVIASVFRQHGILGFWRGQLGTSIRETGGTAAWFGSYEAALAALRRDPSSVSSALRSTDPSIHGKAQSPVHHQLLAGAAAGVAYNFAFFPADTIKARMQTEELSSTSTGSQFAKKHSTFWSTGVQLWQQQGLRGLYRGCGITVARSAPSSAVIFAVYGGLKDWIG
ncbi:MAG: hypothetical protein L6R39_006116 [Caloplaca ligustica]|nr:MAG: hypothetical protein L6R39_006116 [Caloplaca ligustica]